jgi:hypothetical protein
MPRILYGNTQQSNQATDLTSVNYSYGYPDGLDLKPGSKLHDKLRDEVIQRANEANAAVSNRYESWNKIDEVLTTYIPLDEDEEDVKTADGRKPVSIIFPYTYAIHETVLTYLVNAFLTEPIFRYEGVSPEDTIGAVMMEKVIEVHCNKSKIALSLHTMFRDALAYGVGVGAPGWDEKWGFKTKKQEAGFQNLFGRFVGQGAEKVSEEALLFEGNKLENIDPYLYLPDPNVSVDSIQDGEYCGFVKRTNLMNLLSEEETSDGEMFNVKYLRQVKNKRSSVFAGDNSKRYEKTGMGSSNSRAGVDNNTTNPVDVVSMYIKIIPKDWELGDGEYPEKWLLMVANDEVIIRAQPLGLDHDLFPMVACAPDFDGYSALPLSRVEVLYGLQGTLDWLFNSHVANVRKAINDMLVVDPYLVNINDLKDPKPGKLVRMRRPAWGRGVGDAVQQLQVNDITRANIGDSSWIVQWMQKIGAADDPMMGALRSGGPERLTKGEFQGTQAGAASRLGRIARVIGLQAMQDLGYMFASHTQQLMTQDLYTTTTGRWQETIMGHYGENVQRMKVSPFDLLIDYDVLVRDGSVPGGNFSDSWVQMFQILGTSPELQQTFDIGRIFKYIATNMGAKNVDEFVRMKPQVMDDEQVQQQAQAGNIVPMQEAMGGI